VQDPKTKEIIPNVVLYIKGFNIDFNKRMTNEFTSKNINSDILIYAGLKEKAKKDFQVDN
jgi:hypothetical protein